MFVDLRSRWPGIAMGRRDAPSPGVKLPTFSVSPSGRWAEVSTRVGFSLAAGGLVWWGGRHGIYGLLMAAALLIGPVLWIVARPGWGTASRVVVADQFIEAAGYGRRRVRLTWDGIGEVQHFVRATTRGPVRVLRLLSLDRQREVVFNDRLPGFERLMSLVEIKVRHMSVGTPSSWGRLLWSKSPGDEPRR